MAHARDWLLAVRVGLSIPESAEEASAICTASARLLAQDYSKEDLCFASRDTVAATLKWWNEKDIRERLDTWIKVNAPAVEALPAEALAAPIGNTGKWLFARFLRATDDATAIRALDSMRGREQPAFDWVVRNNHAAAGYAVQRGWKPTPTAEGLAADWDDEAAIRRLARRIREFPRTTQWEATIQERAMSTLMMLVGMHARQHFDAAVDEFRSFAEPVPVAFDDGVTLFGEIL